MNIFGGVLSGLEKGFETNSGGHVERRQTSCLEVNFAHRPCSSCVFLDSVCCGSMTPGSREGIGVDGTANPSRKADDCDEEESGEQATEERSTKGDERVEIVNPAPATLSPGSAQPGPALGHQTQPSVEPSAPCHDQHHFLRSSVRPPSKRIRKDSIGSAINGHGGAKSKGNIKQDCGVCWVW